jgi:hypothetical protein
MEANAMPHSCDKKMRYLVSFIAIALAMPLGNAQAQQVTFPKTAAEVPGPPPGTAMTKAYVQTVGRVAYVWGWPLVNMTNRIAAIAKVPGPGLLGGVIPVGWRCLLATSHQMSASSPARTKMSSMQAAGST